MTKSKFYIEKANIYNQNSLNFSNRLYKVNRTWVLSHSNFLSIYYCDTNKQNHTK